MRTSKPYIHILHQIAPKFVLVYFFWLHLHHHIFILLIISFRIWFDIHHISNIKRSRSNTQAIIISLVRIQTLDLIVRSQNGVAFLYVDPDQLNRYISLSLSSMKISSHLSPIKCLMGMPHSNLKAKCLPTITLVTPMRNLFISSKHSNKQNALQIAKRQYVCRSSVFTHEPVTFSPLALGVSLPSAGYFLWTKTEVSGCEKHICPK